MPDIYAQAGSQMIFSLRPLRQNRRLDMFDRRLCDGGAGKCLKINLAGLRAAATIFSRYA